MAARKSFFFKEDNRGSADSIYENMNMGLDQVATTNRNRRSSRGSNSTEGSCASGASSITPSLPEDKPPKAPTKLRISTNDSLRLSGGDGSIKYSYDEVSINFGKPVIFGTDKSPKFENDDDIFGNITFQSPIEDMSAEKKEMLFSAAIASRPVPAPRPSKLQVAQEVQQPNEDKIYEDPDELLQRRFSGKFCDSKAPEVPPRNLTIQNNPKESSKNNSYENVYCEIKSTSVNGDKSKRFENLMDRNDAEKDAENYAENYAEKDAEKGEEDDDVPLHLGARPRNSGKRAKSDTIDIRNTVSRWYEEAEKEVDRDLSLDLSLLEQISSPASTLAKISHLNQYEHVAMSEAKFALVNGQAVKLSSQTLLRDFDPCFEIETSTPIKATHNIIEEESSDSSTDSPPSSDESDPEPEPEPVKGAAALKTTSPKSPNVKDFDSFKLKKSKPVDSSPEGPKENIYVPLPGHRSSGSSIDLPPPSSSPPPPPPRTSPPPKPKHLPGYENVWLGPSGKPSLQPCSDIFRSLPATVITPPLTPPAVPPRQKLPSIDNKSIQSNSSRKSETQSISSKKSETKSTSSKKSSHSKTADSVFFHDEEERFEISKATALTSEGWHYFQNPSSDIEDFEADYSSSDTEAATGDISTPPPQRSFSALNLTSKATKLATNLKRKMSDQVMMRSVLDNRSVLVGTDGVVSLSRKSSASSRKSGNLEGGGSKHGNKSHSGVLFLYSRMKRSFQPKWCVLGNGSFRYFNDKHSLAIPKELIQLNTVLSLRKHEQPTVTGPGDDASPLFCFDLVFSVTPKGKHTLKSFGAPTLSERETWIERLAQSLSLQLETVDMSESSYLTWANLKTGFAGEWSLSWLNLAVTKRILSYTTSELEGHQNILDMKKIKNVTLVKNGKNLSAPDTSLPVLVVDATDRSIYLQLSNEKECSVLRGFIESVAFNSGNSLKDQQLTQEGIPVIIDKCIRFVYSHGCMTEGIYRHSGVNTKILKLLNDFKQNAWNVHIARDFYSEHDVANVLKRFLRTLDEPLLMENLRSDWMETSTYIDQTQKINRYRDLLLQLPTLNYQTLRRLVGHLHAIADKCSKNMMPNYNLATMWGPTLLTVDAMEASNFARTTGESDVCKDLIDFYENLFNVNQEELERERKITEVLEKISLHDRGRFPMKRSGDLRMWVYLDTRSSGNCICVEVHPSMTAFEMTQCVLRETKEESSNLVLHEIVLGGQLERPIHHSEIMLEVTLKWGNWSEDDRKDNYLLLKSNTFYEEALPCAIPPLSVFGEAHFSDNKAKSAFKKHQFSMNNARLTCTRELKSRSSSVNAASSTIEVGSWPIEDICWYLGCESKRKAPYNMNITFIERGKPVDRSKETPQFGRTISFESREFFVKWIASMLVAEHPGDIVPSQALLVID